MISINEFILHKKKMDILNEFNLGNIRPSLNKIIQETPLVSFNDFKKKLQKGDILLVSREMNSFINKIADFVIKGIQLSNWSSSKMYIGNDQIIGYGIKEDKKVDIVSFDYLFSSGPSPVDSSIMLRVPNLTQQQANKAVEFMKRQLNTQYDFGGLPIVVLDKLLGTSIDGNPQFDEEELEAVQYPLICSNVLLAAYRYAGVKIPIENIRSVWPIDMVVDSFFIKVCRFEK